MSREAADATQGTPHRPARRPARPAAGVATCLALAGCALAGAAGAEAADALAVRAAAIFGPLPADAANPANPSTDERVALGRMLYYDARLSKNHDIACNSCHQLDNFGVDSEPTSPGHRGQRGGRNSPTVYNAALHVAQFWDGRASDVEAQAKGPVTNPIEMALPDAAAAEGVLRSIPGYAALFEAAFPGEDQPVTFDNTALAIAAFERTLLTPGPLDDFMRGDVSALDAGARGGLALFIETGCVSCHMGPLVGGSMYQKLGAVAPFDDPDVGRFEVTGEERDRQVFKVPSLRNVAETGPWFHNGRVATLPDAIRLMGRHQLGVELDDAQVASIAAFLGSLTGRVPPPERIARPQLPESGPSTPAPDPS